MNNKIKISQVIFDVDGVFTNGQFLYGKDGKQFKIFGPHDSDGIKMLTHKGISVHAISADERGFQITKKRMDDIGISCALVPEAERLDYILKYGSSDKICFMGDGHFDAMVFSHVAYSIAPSNALKIAKLSASYVTEAPGGNGAVYEACIHLMQLLGH